MPLTSLVRPPDAAQTQRRSPPPHPQDGVQGSELAGIRGGTTQARQPDLMDRGRGTGPLADLWTGRPGSIQGCRDPDHPDGSHGVPAGVAANGGSDGVGHYADGSEDLSAGSQHDQSPGCDVGGDPGGLSAARSVTFVDRQQMPSGLQGEVNGWRRNTARSHRVESGANSIWRSMPATAR